MDQAASVRSFRTHVARTLSREQCSGAPRDIVILATDGIPLALAETVWTHAHIQALTSVFPSTSSTSWLSSLSGACVDEHGIPGVVFRGDDGGLIHAFRYRGPLVTNIAGNIFADARASGYVPLAMLGDLTPYPSTYRDVLLRHADVLASDLFFAQSESTRAEQVARRIRSALESMLTLPSAGLPKLVWCFIDVDQRIHHHGYDDQVIAFLDHVQRLAGELVSRGLVVLAHSDHGLVPTRHDPDIAALLQELEASHGCKLGGAGRTRWVYTAPSHIDQIAQRLEQALPTTVAVRPADTLFEPGSLSRSRVGDIVLIAEGDAFVTFGGDCFDHGSLTQVELLVPYATWST